MQTSWFEGPGHPGPLPDWSGDWFNSSGSADYRSDEGFLSLAFDTCLIDSSLATCSYLKAIDFDFDGDEDLFAATETDGVLKWYENTGSGAGWLEHYISYSIDTIYRFDLADFFFDGVPDLAAVCPNDGTFLLLQYSGGTWTSTVMDSALCRPTGLCIADINNDGLLDVVITEREEGVWGGVSWYENTGSGPEDWSRHTVSTDMVGPSTVYASDYDFDGDQDLCVVDLYGNAVYLCRNEFPAEIWIKEKVAGVVFPEAAPFADIDGSGNLDIVIAELGKGIEGSTGALFWATESSRGEWLMHDLDPDFHRAHWCAPVDVDEDGDIDVYATQVTMDLHDAWLATWCAWWENSGSGSQWTRHDIWFWGIPNISFCRGRFIEDADFDGDGSIDFAVAPYTTNSVKATVLWVDPSSYADQATLTSSILATSSPSDWQYFSWNAECPPGTTVCFQARTGDTPETMGDWSDTLFTTGSLEGFVEGGNLLFQYKAILLTDSPIISPVLEDATLTSEPMGIGESQSPESINALLVSSNPSVSPLTLTLIMGETADAELNCFDASGRSVWHADLPAYEAGTHEIDLPDLPAGLYLITLEASDEIQMVKAILLD